MEREIRAEIAAETTAREPGDEVAERLIRKIGAIRRKQELEKLAAGWTKSPEGHLIPPGYGPIPGWQAPAAEPNGEETPRDSM